MVSTLPLQFGIPGGPELLIILLIAVLLFGANKIPQLARSTGEAMGEFQKGREEVEQELQEMRDGSESMPDTDEEPDIETAEEVDEDDAVEEADDESELDIDDAETDEETN
ncbi:MAG: twin-arginine translocase TatA/TatE family subunit [Halobacteriota archaeon]